MSHHQLSFAQERLWFLDQLGSGQPVYNYTAARRLVGPLRLDALEHALGEIVRRHDTLRTTFVEVDGAPSQVVAPYRGFTLFVDDLTSGDAAGQGDVRWCISEEARRPFDLATGPLFRARALRLADEEHVLLLSMHHIITDGWSIGVLLRELTTLYAAYCEGDSRRSPLLDLPLQYAEYAAAQRAQLQGERLRRDLAYWKTRLAGAPALIDLPTDRPRAAVQTHRGAHERIDLPLELMSQLRAVGRQEGASLFMVLLAAFQAVLARHGGRDDVLVGSPVAGRTRRDVEGLIGLFVNTLVLRADLSGDLTVRELLRRVREVTLGAYEHQAIPFERLVAELQPERSLSHSPIVQVMFGVGVHALFESTEQHGSRSPMPGLRLERIEAETESTKFDLAFTWTASARRFGGQLTYSTDLFDRVTIQRLLRHLRRVLERMAVDPDARLSQIALLDDAERRQVIETWNQTDVDVEPTLVHQRFERQAAATPNAIAVTMAETSLSYRDLNDRADRLAGCLRQLGVGPEARVGLHLERGPDLVAAVLAVLKAGGAYVPLDPVYPPARLAYMLEDAGCRVLLTQDSMLGALPTAEGVHVVSVDRALAGQIEPATAHGVRPDNLAYVLYTSGSTGRPKGVSVSHAALANYLAWAAQTYPGASSAVQTSLSFDLTITSLFVPLLRGGRIELLPQADAIDQLARRMTSADGPQLLKLTPSHLRALAELPVSTQTPSTPACFVVGGEALFGEHLAYWRDRYPDAILVNEYGPTEATVGCCIDVRPLRDAGPGRIAIGRPAWNTRLYVLDPTGAPTPVGLPGELFIGGAQLARGYLNRPAWTADRFVPDPFSPNAGARLYRTGDRVRWREDGSLDYLGRLDEQTKIRGFRIEPAEIEIALRQHPGVTDCVVMVREEAAGDKRLVAYVVGDADPRALRTHLQQQLPSHMIPAAFVRLDRLPVTVNGKLDTKALPAPEYAAPDDRHAEPRTRAEQTLAAIWMEVLRLPRVGIHDNFFELGGDSILSIQIVSRARRAGLEISPPQMFEHQTIAALAAVAGGTPVASPTNDSPVEGPVDLTPIQSWFFEQDHPSPWHYNQSIALEVDAIVDDTTMGAALAAVLAHHDALRLRFRRATTGWESWLTAAAGIALERMDLSDRSPDEQDRVQDEEATRAQRSLDLEHGPLGRAVLFDRGARGRILLLVLHHLIVDSVSWRILRDDLNRAAAQIGRGEPVDLGAKSTSFARWGSLLRKYAASRALRDEADYWLAQIREPQQVRPSRDRDRRTVFVTLDAADTRALLQEVPSAYRTQINDVLLCALADAMTVWTGNSRVRLLLEGHGRDAEIGAGVDLTHTVGWFTTMSPVTLDTASAAGPGERLTRVKERLRAIPNRGIGYGLLRYLSPDEETRRWLASDASEISFNYLGQFDTGSSTRTAFRLTTAPRGRDLAEDNVHACPLAMGARVAEGCLHLRWSFDQHTHSRERIDELARLYVDALRTLIAHCRTAGAGGYSPSDFPLAGLTQAALDALLGRRRGIEDLYPLSPMQEGLLFHALHSDDTQAYQVQFAQQLHGPLDVACFRRTWDEVVRRHAVLRSAFVWERLPRPLQRVDADVELPWTIEDWRVRYESEMEQAAALERYLAEDRARGFQLDAAPLMRCALFRVSDDVHWFVWNRHHVLLDGWSSWLVLNEVSRLYRAWSAGQAVALPHRRAYRDHIKWLERQDARETERYWRERLRGFSSPTPLGADRMSPPDAAVRFANERVIISGDRWRQLEAAARRMQVTINTLLQGAWGLLLARCAGEDDVVFGNVVSGRSSELDGVEEMIGLCMNMLPVRVRLHDAARIRDWLAGLQRTEIESRRYEHSRLVQVQGWSDVPRGTPLFESHFTFENYPVERGSTADAGPVSFAAQRAVEWSTYPLSLVAAATRDRLVLRFGYDTHRFERETITRMLSQLEWVLTQMAADPDARVGNLTLLTTAKWSQVIEEGQGSDRPYPRGVTLGARFAAQVAAQPNAEAVVWGGGATATRLTYAALAARVYPLANHLRAQGVGPDVRVGVRMERGVDLIVAVLAIVQAGACYVPIDPRDPPERAAAVFADAGVMLVLDELPMGLASQPITAPPDVGSPEQLAYIVYTSGSTGRPKGVMVSHRHVLQLVCATDYVSLGPGDRVAQASNPAFDAMTFELWGALLNGATLVGIEADALLSPATLRARLRAERITTLYQTTALLNGLAREQPDVFASVREVLFGGQAADAASVRRVLTAGPPQRLLHMYGPTETTAWCSWAQVREVSADARTVSVGQPTGNARIYLLDRAGQPVPAGVAGEAYVGGAGIVRGYLNRPGLTASRFVPDPFGPPGARLYRTGDRLRRLTDGTLEFVGRLDAQVKIRGFRIEPGEVESELRTHPGVREARVIVREDTPGEPYLAAYVIGDAEADALQAALRRRLPEYLVPTAIVRLDRLPLTRSGKLDVVALPAPDFASAGDRYAPPCTPVEEVLAAIWTEVLRLDRVGRDDNFFALGGHSLLAIRVISQIRELFGVSISPRMIFDAPTIAQLAAALSSDPRYAASISRIEALMSRMRETSFAATA